MLHIWIINGSNKRSQNTFLHTIKNMHSVVQAPNQQLSRDAKKKCLKNTKKNSEAKSDIWPPNKVSFTWKCKISGNVTSNRECQTTGSGVCRRKVRFSRQNVANFNLLTKKRDLSLKNVIFGGQKRHFSGSNRTQCKHDVCVRGEKLTFDLQKRSPTPENKKKWTSWTPNKSTEKKVESFEAKK